MGGLVPKTFPWPAAIGGSPAVQPLNQSQAPTLSGTPTASQNPLPISQPPLSPIRPVSNPISRNLGLYGGS